MVPPDMLDRIKTVTKGDPDAYNSIYLKGPGCDFCSNRGYAGRTVISEVIAFTPEILDVYGAKRNIAAVRVQWLNLGGMSYRHIAQQRLFAGMISPLEFEKNCGDLCAVEEEL